MPFDYSNRTPSHHSEETVFFSVSFYSSHYLFSLPFSRPWSSLSSSRVDSTVRPSGSAPYVGGSTRHPPRSPTSWWGSAPFTGSPNTEAPRLDPQGRCSVSGASHHVTEPFPSNSLFTVPDSRNQRGARTVLARRPDDEQLPVRSHRLHARQRAWWEPR